ncbi:metal-binding protein [Ilyomonas limi]|uniref:Metal-binding protein n=1 Tax=Ilyomonas limi TaxID=2575867 RepID=A0A4U3KYD7_9BACT|nr:Ada metal-binding domain-containing protein [Ilyomonas limi]TKK66137.1 metal-binding protein [Ilyomonas limi]
MIQHTAIDDSDLRRLIRQKKVCFGGNKKLKIYGTLQCASGKWMKKAHRVFFGTEGEAVQHGYRPCGHCMKQQYQIWKHGFIQ